MQYSDILVVVCIVLSRPGADTVLATDGSYVSCSACPHGSSSSSSSSSSVVIGLVVISIVAVILLIYVFYILNQVRNAGHPPPFPIPQSLWQKNTSIIDTNDPLISLTSQP